MILYCAYIILLSIPTISLGPLFEPLFETFNLDTGYRTFAVQALSLIVAALIFVHHPNHKKLTSELGTVVLIWVPFLLFTVIRTDFSDQYAMIKLGRLIVISFISVLTITIVYLSGKSTFDRYFFGVVVGLAILQLFEVLVTPTVVVYASTLERATIEGTNPIWLARCFVTAGLCCLALPIGSHASRLCGAAIFMLAVLPTGSRGPLIAGLIGFGLYLWIYYRNSSNFRLKLSGVVVFALAASIALIPYLAPNIANYFSRDSGQSVFVESGRDRLFSTAIADYLESPVIGAGFGQFAKSAEANSRQFSDFQEGYYPHNLILEIMAELGTFGLIFLLIILRPGKHWLKISNIYQILFVVHFLFAMTSGSIIANSGVMVFGTLALLAQRYPHQSNQIGQKNG